MKVLATGGAGFVGSHVCELLLRKGHEVSIIDNLDDFYSPVQKRRNLEEVLRSGPATFHEADITEPEAVQYVFAREKPEAVVHLAARAGVRPSIRNPLPYEETNVRGTLVLLEAAKQHGVRNFVFVSSSSVYGVANRVPFSEDDTLNLPISPYAATKIAGEKLCYVYSHLHGLRTICLRLFTVYGPRQRPDLAIHKFARLIGEGESIPVYGDGSSGRDYTYVGDIADGICRAVERDFSYEVVNLGNSHPILLRDMIECVSASMGVRPVIDRRPDQPGDVPITYAEVSKAQRLLGYEPKTEFADGVNRFVEWLRQNSGQS